MTIKTTFATLIQEQRLLKQIEREFNAQKRKVDGLRTAMINEMKIAGTTSYAGTGGRLSHREQEVPVVDNWPELYTFISSHAAFDLLQRRLSTTAYRDRIDNGEEIPGIGKFMKDVLTITLTE